MIRKTAALVSAVIFMSCFFSGCGIGKKDSEGKPSFKVSESYETIDYSSEITFELRSEFIPSGDRIKEYDYKNEKISMVLQPILNDYGLTPGTYGDYLSRAVFSNEEIVEQDVIQRNSMDVSVVTADTKGEDGFNYYTSYDMFCKNHHCVSFSMYYTDENKDFARFLADEIMNSVKLPQKDYSSEPAGEIEKKSLRLNAGDKWCVNEHFVDDVDRNNNDFGLVSLRYCISENLDDYFSTIVISTHYKDENHTAKTYMDEKLKSVSKSNSKSYSSKPEKTTFHGDDAYVFEYNTYKYMMSETVVYYVEHKDIVYSIRYSYGLYDDTAEDIKKDILDVLDTIEFRDDVSAEDISKYLPKPSEEISDEE